MNTSSLTGTRYPFVVEIDGLDLVVRNVSATWFGGSNDPQDDGTTASGLSTRSNPGFLGCALPMDYHRPHDNPCAGSPLPKLPWFSNVEVTNRANQVSKMCKLIDLGPSAPPQATASIDLTQAFFSALGGDLKAGRLNVDYRIIGGARLIGITPVTVPEGTLEPPTPQPMATTAPVSSLTVTPTFGPTITA